MNNRERVLAALNHRQPDKVPYNVAFTHKMRAQMADFYGDPEFVSGLGNCLTLLHCEPANSWQEVEPDIWQDQFGVRWDRSIDKDIGTPCNRMVTKDTLDVYQWPDPGDPTRYDSYDTILGNGHARREQDDRFIVVNHGFSLFERAWTLYGMENLLMDMVSDKSFVHKLLDRILAFNLEIIDHVCTFDVDAMMFGDDWGMQIGLIMGPKLWREFIKPRIAQMYGAVRSSRKFVFIHSCGKVDAIFPDLIECGLNVFNPFQPEVMDVFEIKRQYGDRLSFYGGISIQKTLPYGTVQQVQDEVRWLIDKVGRDGGYIASPSHDIPADARPENVAAMIEVLQSQ
ncbi:MAG: hypothetical protein JXA89_15000 [Anaerolineae bacterium]|nr:hypothetical protein [Anaerolineae bacterium]